MVSASCRHKYAGYVGEGMWMIKRWGGFLEWRRDFDSLHHLYHSTQLSFLLYSPFFQSSLLLPLKYLHLSLKIWPHSLCHSFHPFPIMPSPPSLPCSSKPPSVFSPSVFLSLKPLSLCESVSVMWICQTLVGAASLWLYFIFLFFVLLLPAAFTGQLHSSAAALCSKLTHPLTARTHTHTHTRGGGPQIPIWSLDHTAAASAANDQNS